jgi:hypothetical protein
MSMILRTAPPLRLHRMCIVEADQALTSRPMQGQRIIETMRFLPRDGYPGYDEPDPVIASRIDNEYLPIQGKKHIKSRVARFQCPTLS